MRNSTFGSRIQYIIILSLIFLTLSSWTSGNLYAQISISINSKTNASCPDAADGAIQISIQGGTPDYVINWTGPNSYTKTGVENISGLKAGTYTINVTDNSEPALSTSQNIVINGTDNENPTITAPADKSGNTSDDGSGDCTTTIALGTPNSNDNCGVATLKAFVNGNEIDPNTYAFPIGDTNVTWTVTDNSSRNASDTQTVTVTDNENPTITAPADKSGSTSDDGSGDCTTTIALGTPNSNDNCGVATLKAFVNGNEIDPNTYAFPIGDTNVTWTVTDNSSRTASDTQTVTVTDNENPTITAPADKSGSTSDDGSGDCTTTIALGTPITNDNCGVATLKAFVNGNEIDPNTYAFPIGDTNVTWTVTDNSSRTASDTQTVTVTDNENPTITAPADKSGSTSDDGSGDCTTTIALGTPNSNDNCGVATLKAFVNGNEIDPNTYAFPIGDTNVTWTVTDNSSRTASDTQTVTVTDNENPTITAPADKSGSTSDDGSGDCTTTIALGTPNSNDNCGVATLKAFVNGNEIDPNTYAFPIGDTNVTWTVTDNSSRTASDTQTVTVTDNENPTITAPADKSGSTSDDGSGDCTTTIALGTPNSNDNCGVATLKAFVNGNEIDPNTYAFPIGDTNVTWTVTDNSSRTASDTQTVTVTDNENPTITAPADKSGSTSDDGSGDCTTTIALGTPNSNDNCGVATLKAFVNGNEIDPNTYAFPIGDTNVTWTVTDNSSRNASDTQTVTVTDNEKPTITCIGDQTKSVDNGSCDYTVKGTEFNIISFDDNCNGATITNNYNNSNSLAGATFPLGQTDIIWTVTDATGNTENCTSKVTISDTEDPTMSCVEDQTKSTDSGKCYYTVVGTEFNPSAVTDNCSVESLTNDFNSSSSLAGAQIPDGTLITWTLTDSASNTITCSFTVTVNDIEPPTVPVLPDLSEECSITLTPPTTTDNCGNVITGSTGIDLTIDESKSIFWIFTDAAGNSTPPVEQIITIADTQAPVPDQSSLPKKSITGCQISNISELNIPTATDACDGIINGTLSEDFQFPYSFYGTNNVTWEFIDSSGNISTQQQEIELLPVSIEGGTLEGKFNSTVFQQQIDVSACGSDISVDLTLSGKTGSIVQWEKFAVNEGKWEIISNTTTTYTANFGVGALESTYYRVLVKSGSCTDYSNSFYIRALPAGDAPTVTNLDSSNKYCLGDDVNLLATSNYLATQPAIPSSMSPGDFNQGQLNTQDPDSWLVDGETGGFTAGGNSKKPRNWSGTNDHEFGGILYDSEDGKFAIAQGDFSDNQYKGPNPTTLESPILDLSNAASASLDFDQAFYFANNDIAVIEVSTDGGTTYSNLKVMHSAGSGIKNWFSAGTAQSTTGSNSTNYYFKTDNTSIPLDAYIGLSNVRIRWSFVGTSDKSVWAMDNIFVNNQVLVETELEWTNGIGNPEENPIEKGKTSIPLNFIPKTPGMHQYGGTALINGCRTYSEEGTDLIDIGVSYSYAGEDIIFDESECGQNTVQLNAYDNTLTANENATKGSYPSIPDNCKSCDIPGTGDIGTWSWSGETPSCTDASFSDVNNPDATFTAGPGTYTLTWTVDGCSNEITVTIKNCEQINFDGIDDHIDFYDNYELEGGFSVEVWIKPESLAGNQTIFSKRDANYSGNSKGYDLSMEDGEVSFNWDKTGTIVSPHKIPDTNRWYHIALTHSASGEYKLYIDGILMKLVGGDSPGENDNKAILGAMDNYTSGAPSNFFNGWMEELRIWNIALTSDQLHQMMNQRINKSGTDKVEGEIIPLKITNLNWNNLVGYYRMDDVGCGNIYPYSIDGTNYIGATGKLKNITSPQENTAPLPYISNSNRPWREKNTWLHPEVWTWPNDTGINGDEIKWNIARIKDNINSEYKDIYLLGLLSESGELTMAGEVDMSTGKGIGNPLTITHYLKLDGVIDLNGESQLIQIENSKLDDQSSGTIEIDQQGKANSFNYNYWTSPVSLANSPINSGFKIGDILNDGTDPTDFEEIDFEYQYYWADNYDYNSAPKRISTYWLYTFGESTENYNGEADNYFEWHQISQNDLLPAGIGYSMKGTSGGVDLNKYQNYTFEGLPNNGDINLSISNGQNKLIGNPYPSAIDGELFLNDNLSSLNGALYFWDHFGKVNSHYLEEYIGGYAVFNKSGSIPAISTDERIDNEESYQNRANKKYPGRYIPVGQAFFISTAQDDEGSSSSGGEIIFKNTQRVFAPEKSGNSQFLSQERSSQAEYNEDKRYKIRLHFASPKGYHRQILVTADEHTTNNFDLGYDAPLIEDNVEDMYWIIDESEFVIQAVPNFNADQVLPVGLKIDQVGEFSIEVEALENIEGKFMIYLRDKLDDSYYNLKEEAFTTTADPGFIDDRFEIVFSKPSEEVDNPENPELPVKISDDLALDYLRSSKEIVLINPSLLEIEHIELYSLNGQRVGSFKEIPVEKEIIIPIENEISSAVYIIRVFSKTGVYSRKVIINN